MKEIKKGNVVARKSHNKDILFVVKDIQKINNKEIIILSGLVTRIIADAPLKDLELVSKQEIISETRKLNDKLQKRIDRTSYKDLVNSERRKKIIYTGKILHLDGDKN